MNTPQNLERQVPPSVDGGVTAIILAGGLGTRLRSVVSDVPKCMAPVNGIPFLHYVIEYLKNQGVEKFIFSIGYLSEAIEHFLSLNHSSLHYQLSVEEEPLGTGGAIYLALQKSTAENVFALNGDTLFKADLHALHQLHIRKQAACSLALKPMRQFDRYGVVELDENNCISSFKEKKYYENGLINGGIYLINRPQFLARPFPQKFSFEKDYLESTVEEGTLYGIEQDEYFIDIGIPQDYEKAQKDLAE